MLTRIRNAGMRGKSTVMVPASKMRVRVLNVLASEGYIRGFEDGTDGRGHPTIEISLKYFEGAPAIRQMKRVSKPGRRVYAGAKDLPSVRQGLGVSIVSTPQGCDVGRKRTRGQCWRRSALHRILRRSERCPESEKGRSPCPQA